MPSFICPESPLPVSVIPKLLSSGKIPFSGPWRCFSSLLPGWKLLFHRRPEPSCQVVYRLFFYRPSTAVIIENIQIIWKRTKPDKTWQNLTNLSFNNKIRFFEKSCNVPVTLCNNAFDGVILNCCIYWSFIAFVFFDRTGRCPGPCCMYALIHFSKRFQNFPLCTEIVLFLFF